MSGRWHPILAAIEDPTGTWRILDGFGHEYGRVELRRVNGGADARYKAFLRGDHIGWSTTLRSACEHVHAAYLLQHGPGGGAIADWGELTGHGRRGMPPTGVDQ